MDEGDALGVFEGVLELVGVPPEGAEGGRIPESDPRVARERMADKAMDVYLNDHLAGAMLGSDLAGQLCDRETDPSRRELLKGIAADIDADRETLLGLMESLDVSRNPVKQVGGWLSEKASRVKFSGASSGEPDHGAFMALETLRLGVAGKKCLWLALKEARGEYPQLNDVDLDRLIKRASTQEDHLERERIATAERALTSGR